MTDNIIAGRFTQCSGTGLTVEERIVYEWQYDLDGGFRHSLMNAISKADGDNLECLRKGFPIHVRAYERFSQERGWFESIQKRMGK